MITLQQIRLITASFADIGLFIACMVLAFFLFLQTQNYEVNTAVEGVIGMAKGTVL